VLSSLTRRAYIFYAGRVMESGVTASLLTAPAHPYTAALLGARPHGLSAHRTLRAIPGAPVLPDQLLPGCPFEPRCAFAESSCRDTVPPNVPTTDERTLACLIAPDLGSERRVAR
jgi:oligopeptide/dipeptide ABC transporter ATP-binding protein